jgi:hypothetical protein
MSNVTLKVDRVLNAIGPINQNHILPHDDVAAAFEILDAVGVRHSECPLHIFYSRGQSACQFSPAQVLGQNCSLENECIATPATTRAHLPP